MPPGLAAPPSTGSPTLWRSHPVVWLTYSPSSWLILSSTLPGWQSPCPLSLPPTPTQKDLVAQARMARRAGRDSDRQGIRSFCCHPRGSGPGLGWGQAELKMATWLPGRQEEEEADRCCLLFPEGRDRIWPGVLLGWLEAEGLPDASPGVRPALCPRPRQGSSCKAQGGGQRQGPPASPAAHSFAPSQASSGPGRQSRGQPGKALLPAWAAAGSQQKTKAAQTRLASVLVWRPWWRKGPGARPSHPQSGCTPAAYTPSVCTVQPGPGYPRVTSGTPSLCVPNNRAAG